MKSILISSLAFFALFSAVAADSTSEDLTRATVVEVLDQTVSGAGTASIIITNSDTVAALARTIQNAPGKWEKGSFTAPTGRIRFAFQRGSELIGVIGLGDRFLVRGGGGDWQFKKITKDLEEKISAFGKQASPNKSLQAGRDGRFCFPTVSGFTSFGPACLSSGR